MGPASVQMLLGSYYLELFPFIVLASAVKQGSSDEEDAVSTLRKSTVTEVRQGEMLSVYRRERVAETRW